MKIILNQQQNQRKVEIISWKQSQSHTKQLIIPLKILSKIDISIHNYIDGSLNQSEMHNFEDYLKREILNLVADEKCHARSARVSRVSSITKDTPYVVSLKKNDNTYWKTHSRQRLSIPSNLKEHTTGKTYTVRQTLNRSKSAFYRNLLKAQKTLNQKASTQRKTIKPSNRKGTQATNSTHRRQVLDSHMQLKKLQNQATLQLMIRQFSTASDNYLRAKLEHSKHRPTSILEGFSIVKI